MGVVLIFALSPRFDKVETSFWLLTWRCISCTLKIPRIPSDMSFLRSRASVMVIVLGSQILSIFSSNFKLIYSLEKIFSNISSMLYHPSWWKIHTDEWGWYFYVVARLHFPRSLSSMGLIWQFLTCKLFYTHFFIRHDESVPYFVVQLHLVELFILSLLLWGWDFYIISCDNLLQLVMYGLDINLHLILPNKVL